MRDLIALATAWRDADIDPDTREELDHLIVQAQANNDDLRSEALSELASAFAGPLEFGTAGLRGKIGPGPSRMNRVVVTQAAAGFAAFANRTARRPAMLFSIESCSGRFIGPPSPARPPMRPVLPPCAVPSRTPISCS